MPATTFVTKPPSIQCGSKSSDEEVILIRSRLQRTRWMPRKSLKRSRRSWRARSGLPARTPTKCATGFDVPGRSGSAYRYESSRVPAAPHPNRPQELELSEGQLRRRICACFALVAPPRRANMRETLVQSLEKRIESLSPADLGEADRRKAARPRRIRQWTD